MNVVNLGITWTGAGLCARLVGANDWYLTDVVTGIFGGILVVGYYPILDVWDIVTLFFPLPGNDRFPYGAFVLPD